MIKLTDILNEGVFFYGDQKSCINIKRNTKMVVISTITTSWIQV